MARPYDGEPFGNELLGYHTDEVVSALRMPLRPLMSLMP